MSILHVLSLGLLPIYSPYQNNFSLIVENENKAFAEIKNEAAVVSWLPFIFRSDSVFGNKSITNSRYYENSILQLFKAE